MQRGKQELTSSGLMQLDSDAECFEQCSVPRAHGLLELGARAPFFRGCKTYLGPSEGEYTSRPEIALQSNADKDLHLLFMQSVGVSEKPVPQACSATTARLACAPAAFAKPSVMQVLALQRSLLEAYNCA